MVTLLLYMEMTVQPPSTNQLMSPGVQEKDFVSWKYHAYVTFSDILHVTHLHYWIFNNVPIKFKIKTKQNKNKETNNSNRYF